MAKAKKCKLEFKASAGKYVKGDIAVFDLEDENVAAFVKKCLKDELAIEKPLSKAPAKAKTGSDPKPEDPKPAASEAGGAAS
ncbi:MAG: hypothetical protein AAF415_02310 [Pseudomonadota bacterium]